MDVFEAFIKRHSYRGPFKNQDVPREDLRKIVQAGLIAPSGKNCQTTSFVIVDDTDLLGQICSMPGANVALQQARALIACITDVNPEPVYEQYSFQVEDCAAAVENMMLAVAALEYATVWIDGWLRVSERARTISDLLGLPEEKIVRIVLPIGVPEEEHKQPEKLPFEERAWFNKYMK